MKNMAKNFGIIVLFAIIIFSMSSCKTEEAEGGTLIVHNPNGTSREVRILFNDNVVVSNTTIQPHGNIEQSSSSNVRWTVVYTISNAWNAARQSRSGFMSGGETIIYHIGE